MSEYTQKFKMFARDRVARQGEEIRQWVKSDNSLLSQTCKEIIEAAREQP